MKVSELAADLEVPTSMILDQCQRFGIDASWAGAELSGTDVVVLRAELTMADPIDLTPADGPVGGAEASMEPNTGTEPESGAGSGVGTPAALPPTAVGSMPEILDEITPEPDSESESEPAVAAARPADGTGPDAPRRGISSAAASERRLEKGTRNSVVALVIAVACFAASNFTALAVLVVLLWLVTALALVAAVFDGFRGRRRVQTHPERLKGAWLASFAIALAVGGLIGLTSAAFAATGDDPAADAPANLGDLQSVQVARWGYQRMHRLSDNGWKQPARPVGSCWRENDKKVRDEQRVEISELSNMGSCTAGHTMQVMAVFAVNRDADAPYPGTAKLLTLGQDECGSIARRLTAKDVEFAMKVEYPTEVGWSDGDHDVACVAITPARSAPLDA